MELGMVGLGRMGGNMALRLVRGGHRVVGSDPGADARRALATAGGVAADDLAALVRALAAPRCVWIMVPSGDATESVVKSLGSLLERGDILVDGGNSNYRDSV